MLIENLRRFLHRRCALHVLIHSIVTRQSTSKLKFLGCRGPHWHFRLGRESSCQHWKESPCHRSLLHYSQDNVVYISYALKSRNKYLNVVGATSQEETQRCNNLSFDTLRCSDFFLIVLIWCHSKTSVCHFQSPHSVNVF